MLYAKRILIFCFVALFVSCTEQGVPSSTKSVLPKGSGSTVSTERSSTDIKINLAPGDPGAVFDDVQMAAAVYWRGGVLYDKWWRASSQNPSPVEPAIDAVHPLYPSSINPKQGPDTFRCKECHGWDYQGVQGAYGVQNGSHYTGISGVVNDAQTYAYSTDVELWTFLHDGDAAKGLADHAFGNELSDLDIYNLTRFVLNVRAEFAAGQGAATFISPAKEVTGDALTGAELFMTNSARGGASCSNIQCHGPTGRYIFLTTTIDVLAKDNPWETLHKIRFGQPGSTMVGMEALGNPALGIPQSVDVLKFVQVGLEPDGIRGGRLYDNWPVETGMPVVSSANPLWSLADASLTGGVVPEGAESWRCSLCHGFDYEGSIAFFYNSLLYLKDHQIWTTDHIFIRLRDGFSAFMPDGTVQTVHNFGPHMTDTDLWDLAGFVVNYAGNTSQYLLPDLGTAVGNSNYLSDPANGQAIYEGSLGVTVNGSPFDCKSCHDPATGLVPGVDISLLSWQAPWQTFHRIRFGMPRDPAAPAEVLKMPGLLEATASDESRLHNGAVVDVQRFLQDRLLAP